MGHYDLYDVLAELGYGLASKTRSDRAAAFSYKNALWLEQLPKETRETLLALTEQFGKDGTEALENPHIFELSGVKRAGGLPALRILGGPRSSVKPRRACFRREGRLWLLRMASGSCQMAGSGSGWQRQFARHRGDLPAASGIPRVSFN